MNTFTLRVFVERQRRLLRVVEEGRLVGIITRADVLRALTTEAAGASSFAGHSRCTASCVTFTCAQANSPSSWSNDVSSP